MIKLLYCGMADDILTALQLVPDVDVIYAICTIDAAFYKNGTTDGVVDDIITMLINGHDKVSSHANVYGDRLIPIVLSPSKIISILHLKSKKAKDERVQIDFEYQGKHRTLIYYPRRDFCTEWPLEITQISHLTSLGAEFPVHSNGTLRKNIEERSTKDCIFYEQWDYAQPSDLLQPPYKLNSRHGPIKSYKMSDVMKLKAFPREYYED